MEFLQKIFGPIIKPFQSKLLKPLLNIKKLPNTIAKNVKNNLTSLLNPKEITIKNYIKIGRYYIAKKLLVILLLIAVVLTYFLFIKPPAFINKLFNQPTIIQADSKKAATFSGKAIIVDEKDQIVYEGLLQEGLYTGYGKLYLSDSETLIYEGEFVNGLRHGYGTSYDDQGTIIYEGNFENDSPHGTGKTYKNGKLYYKGIHDQGRLTGNGEVYNEKGELIYKGELINGIYSGKGVLYKNSRIVYDGEFSNGKFSGKGISYFLGKMVYNGEFLNGMYGGQGVEYFANGNVKYEGQFVNGEYSGEGKRYHLNGNMRYEGSFLAGAYHGNGIKYDENGIIIYSGTFQNNQYHGSGSLFNKNGTLHFEGEFRNNQYHLGTLYTEDETPLYKGFFEDGKIAPWLFLGITEERLNEILEEPSSEVTLNDTINISSVEVIAPTTEEESPTIDEPALPIEGPQEPSEIDQYPKKLIYSSYGMSFIVELKDIENMKKEVTDVIIFKPELMEKIVKYIEKNKDFVKNVISDPTFSQINLYRQDNLLITVNYQNSQMIHSIVINGSYTPKQENEETIKSK